MTIALGILANDGVVMAADSEETSATTKRDHSKITCHLHAGPYGKRVCLTTGAGSGPYIDAFEQEFQRTSWRRDDFPSVQPVEAFSASVRDFYTANVIPFAAYPRDERPDFQMLIGYSAHDSFSLFQSSQAVVTECRWYAAVGIGADMALTLLQRIYDRQHPPDLAEALLMASYVVCQVKDTVPYCGKRTEIWRVSSQSIGYVYPNLAVILDDAMRDYSEMIECAVWRRIAGGGNEDYAQIIEGFRERFVELTAQLPTPTDGEPR